MSARTTLNGMHAIDEAWNARDWEAYGRLLADDLVAYASGDATAHGKADHIAKAKDLCTSFPDARVASEQYLELFTSHDGIRSASVARLTGTERRSGRSFDVTFAVINRWKDGRIATQRQFLDIDGMRRQLGQETSTEIRP